MAITGGGLVYTEYAGNGGELPTTYRWGDNDSQVAQILDVIPHGIDLQGIPREILGWSHWNNVSKTIERHPPIRHGHFDWYYAKAITTAHGVGKRTRVQAPEAARMTDYIVAEIMRCTVLFSTLPYQTEADPVSVGHLGFTAIKEYHRYCEHFITPGIEIIERQIGSGQFKFANGPSAPDTKFPRSLMRRSPKSHWLIRQHQVPHGALFKPNHVLKPHFLDMLGKVNDSAWPVSVSSSDPVAIGVPIAGYRAGTLLFVQMGLNPVEAPVAPVDVGCSPRSRMPRCWTVDFHLQILDPPTDPDYDYQGYYGHLLAPSITADLNANYYYVISSNGQMTGKKVYEATDFENLFTYDN